MAHGGVHPTFFEWIYLMAMLWFKEQGVETAVVETGMGGRLIATNIVRHPAACVITSIGYDHMQYLGNTLEAISGEKAGIIKAEHRLFMTHLQLRRLSSDRGAGQAS